MATTSLRMTNKLLSKIKSKISCGDHKKTQQGVFNVLLHYIYFFILFYNQQFITWSMRADCGSYMS